MVAQKLTVELLFLCVRSLAANNMLHLVSSDAISILPTRVDVFHVLMSAGREQNNIPPTLQKVDMYSHALERDCTCMKLMNSVTVIILATAL